MHALLLQLVHPSACVCDKLNITTTTTVVVFSWFASYSLLPGFRGEGRTRKGGGGDELSASRHPGGARGHRRSRVRSS